MKAIYDSGIPIDFKGSMVLKACLLEAGYTEEIRHTVDIDANWYSEMAPTAEQMTASLQKALANSGSKRFLEEHREEITLHKAAKAAFNQLSATQRKGKAKIPTIKQPNQEYAQVLSGKKRPMLSTGKPGSRCRIFSSPGKMLRQFGEWSRKNRKSAGSRNNSIILTDDIAPVQHHRIVAAVPGLLCVTNLFQSHFEYWWFLSSVANTSRQAVSE